jgi:hypothetical protein
MDKTTIGKYLFVRRYRREKFFPDLASANKWLDAKEQWGYIGYAMTLNENLVFANAWLGGLAAIVRLNKRAGK